MREQHHRSRWVHYEHADIHVVVFRFDINLRRAVQHRVNDGTDVINDPSTRAIDHIVNLCRAGPDS